MSGVALRHRLSWTRRGLIALVCSAPVACRGRPHTEAGLPSSALFTAAEVALGDSIFHARACRRCHGPGGSGGTNGPNLTDSVWLQIDGSYDQIVRVITEGVPLDRIRDASHTLDMQPRGGRQNPLSDPQIRAVAAYVFTLRKRS